jgi:hypothetical protein
LKKRWYHIFFETSFVDFVLNKVTKVNRYFNLTMPKKSDVSRRRPPPPKFRSTHSLDFDKVCSYFKFIEKERKMDFIVLGKSMEFIWRTIQEHYDEISIDVGDMIIEKFFSNISFLGTEKPYSLINSGLLDICLGRNEGVGKCECDKLHTKWWICKKFDILDEMNKFAPHIVNIQYVNDCRTLIPIDYDKLTCTLNLFGSYMHEPVENDDIDYVPKLDFIENISIEDSRVVINFLSNVANMKKNDILMYIKSKKDRGNLYKFATFLERNVFGEHAIIITDIDSFLDMDDSVFIGKPLCIIHKTRKLTSKDNFKLYRMMNIIKFDKSVVPEQNLFHDVITDTTNITSFIMMTDDDLLDLCGIDYAFVELSYKCSKEHISDMGLDVYKHIKKNIAKEWYEISYRVCLVEKCIEKSSISTQTDMVGDIERDMVEVKLPLTIYDADSEGEESEDEESAFIHSSSTKSKIKKCAMTMLHKLSCSDRV